MQRPGCVQRPGHQSPAAQRKGLRNCFPVLCLVSQPDGGREHRLRHPWQWFRKIARKQRVGQMLELVGLPGLDHRYPAQLSGGQQQRIAIARALATAPGLLLLDEPLSALDAIERVRLRTEIHRLQKRLGVTTIMVTHDQEEALAVADRIIVMNAGRIEQSGTPVEIYQHPSTGFVAGFVGRMNHIDALASSEHQARCQALLLECVEPMRPGQSYRFGIRPEDIELLPGFGDQPGDAAHEAQVQKVEYLGALSVVSVLLAAAGGLELHVQVDITDCP